MDIPPKNEGFGFPWWLMVDRVVVFYIPSTPDVDEVDGLVRPSTWLRVLGMPSHLGFSKVSTGGWTFVSIP